MIFPEVPLVELSFRAKCPACSEIIGGHVVSDNFECPFCHAALSSNKRRCLNQSIWMALALYFLCFVVFNFLPKHSVFSVGIFLFASVIPLVFGYAWFKYKFQVFKRDEAL